MANRLVGGVVRLKPGVEIRTLAPAGLRILTALDQAAEDLGLDLTLTSASEADWRAPTDPHQTGEAFDVSVKGFSPDEILRLFGRLRLHLGPRFTVLFEVPTKGLAALTPELREIAYPNPKATGAHFHLQRRKNTVWPPPEGE